MSRRHILTPRKKEAFEDFFAISGSVVSDKPKQPAYTIYEVLFNCNKYFEDYEFYVGIYAKMPGRSKYHPCELTLQAFEVGDFL